MNKGSILIADAITGNDYRSVIVNNKRYFISPPTINTLCHVAKYMNPMTQADSLIDIIRSINDSSNLSYALSYFICGNESLHEELSHGTIEEVTEAISDAYSMISAENFLRLSALAKNVQSLIAKGKA